MIKQLINIALSIILFTSCSTQKAISKLNPACQKCAVEKVKASHRKIHTEIVIDAPISKVWSVLTDFDKMHEWSSTFKGMTGDIRDGGKVEVLFNLNPKRNKITVYHHNLIYKNGLFFGWEGDVFTMGMRDNHFYRLIDLGNNQTKLIQSDESKGGMTWMMGGVVTKIMLKGYNTFNNEFKRRVESL